MRDKYEKENIKGDMREILFRGKTAVSDQWKYGGYESMPHTEHLAIIKENKNRHTVFNSTVGQYIGEKDNADNNIFEGDILYYQNDIILNY